MTEREWFAVADAADLPEGRVVSVTARTTTLRLAHHEGRFVALDNRCPHQGGPLGEGSIERNAKGRCMIRCPWRGWGFDPATGESDYGGPRMTRTMFPVELRQDGKVYLGLEPGPPHAHTVTDVMAESLERCGLARVFGMVGHSNLGPADALRRRVDGGSLAHVGVRHEGAAAFAVSAYGKLTGRPAACLTIAGPGATNLLTGLWDAKVDRAPVLALTGQVQTQVFGPGAFQDIDLAAAFSAVTRFSHTILPGSNHAELAMLAMKDAVIERDVAHLIFPDDVQSVPSKAAAKGLDGRLAGAVARPSEDDLAEAERMIAAAERPVVIMGHGAVEARAHVLALAEKVGAPVMTTFKGKGLIADDHPLAAGVLGRSGTPIASYFMNAADLLICLGSSFANRTGVNRMKKIIQVDFERMQLGKFHPVALPIWGEIGAFCDAVTPKAARKDGAPDQIAELAERWAIWRREKERRMADDHEKALGAAALFAVLSRLAPEDAILAVDVGNNAYSFGRYFETKGAQRVLMSGYLGSVGFGLPAAIGAWSATQDFDAFRGRKVIAISGDGGFGQYPMEFATAVKYGMNITHVLSSNGELGKISKEQRAGAWPVWETALVNPSFAVFARLCGGMGVTVKKVDQLEDALGCALAHDGPALVEAMTDAGLV